MSASREATQMRRLQPRTRGVRYWRLATHQTAYKGGGELERANLGSRDWGRSSVRQQNWERRERRERRSAYAAPMVAGWGGNWPLGIFTAELDAVNADSSFGHALPATWTFLWFLACNPSRVPSSSSNRSSSRRLSAGRVVRTRAGQFTSWSTSPPSPKTSEQRRHGLAHVPTSDTRLEIPHIPLNWDTIIMVVLAASICTRGGKAVLSRQFREMQRSRIEALLASFPKLADSGTQHTICEQDNVRYVYQPLDELYMVLITNLQSNILQDINSLHLFAQVVSSICKSLDEREILKNAFELLSAFDEIVTMGYRENLTLTQIKTFLDMESHEERIQEIIARNKELEASEERKRRAKQLEMQRKEMSRSSRAGGGGMGGGMGGGSARTPQFPSYTPSTPATVPDTYDSYEAEKKKAAKPLAMGKKGMQLGKKNKNTTIFEQVAGDMPPESEPLISPPKTSAPAAAPASARQSTSTDREPVHITTSEFISARLDREGLLKSFEVKGEMQLKITDPAFTQVKLDLLARETRGAQLMTHPKVDKSVFKNSKAIQLADASKGFPVNMGIGVMKWKLAPKPEDVSDPPITFRVWVEDSGNSYNITVEYELTGGDALKDVTVTIPYQTEEPHVSSFDAVYEVSGDSIEWNIGTVDDESSSGSFEFEASADSDAEFFPMKVRFSKTTPFVDVSVASVTLLSMNEEINFSKDIKSITENYEIV
ncbi:hypothetical protein BDV95DRAFT_592264 [Massariosphaeria phaeospora]|uniref:Coatomer subunit delta n=1 Tax=Massariosphaeria phaeospora TaxID=100035 RepID=A0A7C8MIH1_9PLEO|nr:hypothetical protein BDV95DRAFT_592264 [Massariosphaeria phaeospora]